LTPKLYQAANTLASKRDAIREPWRADQKENHSWKGIGVAEKKPSPPRKKRAEEERQLVEFHVGKEEGTSILFTRR